jgi:hypothetical protein
MQSLVGMNASTLDTLQSRISPQSDTDSAEMQVFESTLSLA